MSDFLKGYFKHKTSFAEMLEYVEVNEELDIRRFHYKNGTVKNFTHSQRASWTYSAMKRFIEKGEWVPYSLYLYDNEDLFNAEHS